MPWPRSCLQSPASLAAPLIGLPSSLPIDPNSALGSGPQPLSSAGLTGTQPGHTEPPGHGGSCQENPAFLALGLGLRLQPSRCHSQAVAPFPPPLGVFPSHGPAPPQDSLTEPPSPAPRVFLLLRARPMGTWDHGAPDLALCRPLALLLAWEAQAAPHFAAGKHRCRRGDETCLQPLTGKQVAEHAWLRNQPGTLCLKPRGLRQRQARRSGAGVRAARRGSP